VPFQFSRLVREHLRGGAFLQSSSGTTVTDLDGNRFYDLTGSYGVNLFGYDFYKECIERGSERVRELGPVLGAYHPVIDLQRAAPARDLRSRRGVAAHVGYRGGHAGGALARYHTRRRYLVRFCGAYHGWWGDVQPGVGNPVAARDTYTLKDMDEASLRVLRTPFGYRLRAGQSAAGAASQRQRARRFRLIDSARSAHFDRAAYTRGWRRSCARCAPSATSC
jgi:glutamate-1-semialdehyde 2,1-aminomutase